MLYSDNLLEMQRASRERHPAPVYMKERSPEEKQKQNEAVAKITAIMKARGIRFVKASDYPSRKKKVLKLIRIKPPEPISVVQPKKQVPVKSMFDSPQKPPADFRKNNKHEGRAIFDPKDRVPTSFKRPPAVYDNVKPSPYGIEY